MPTAPPDTAPRYTRAQLTAALKRITEDPLACTIALGYQGTREGRKRFGKFHRDMVDHTLRFTRSSTVVPRGHAKSTVVTVGKNCWRLIRNPGERIMIASAGLDLAKQMVGEIRDRLSGTIEPLPGLHLPIARVFPWAAPVNPTGKQGPAEAFNVRGRTGWGREPNVFSASPQTNLAGKHPTAATIDDPANEQNSETFKRRQDVIDFMEELEPMMFSSESPIDHIGTPWAFSDVTAHLGQHEDWHQYRFGVWDGPGPAGEGPGPDGKWPLCPSFLNAEEIYALQKRVSKQFFAAQYLCDPIPAEDALFSDEEVRAATAGTPRLEDLPEAGHDILLLDPVAAVDGDPSDRNGLLVVRVLPASALGIPSSEMAPDRNVFVIRHAEESAGNLDHMLRRIERGIAEREWPRLRAVWIEDVIFSGAVKPWLEARGNLRGVRVRAQKVPRRKLMGRLQGFPTAFRRGVVRLAPEFEGRNLFVERLTQFPRADFDDLPAALALLGAWLDRHGRLPGDDEDPPGDYSKRMWWDDGGGGDGTII